MMRSHNILEAIFHYATFHAFFTATANENQSKTSIYSIQHFIGSRNRLLQKVAFTVRNDSFAFVVDLFLLLNQNS